MYIYLTRHGETLWNVQGRTQGTKDIPLTGRGIQQADELAMRLENEGITQIYTSSLERAYQTAVIVGAKIGIKPEKMDELKEVNFGIWEGLSRQEIEDNYPGQLERHRSDFNFAPECGESLASLESRIRKFIKYMINNKGKRVLLVTHACPIRMLIVELMGLAKEYLWSFQLSNGGISVISLDSSVNFCSEPWKLGDSHMLCLNDTGHLYKHNTLQCNTE